ncbi:MAG: helix-turn-helix domain-containing protein [Pseudomonadota bacterium]
MGTINTKEFAPLLREAKEETLIQIREKYKGNAKIDQRSRLLVAIRQFPISTFEARKFLDIMHPAGRIMELRKCGWLIDTLWISEPSDIGKLHRIAVYLLRAQTNE